MSDNLPEGWAEATLGDVITGFEAGRNLRAKGGPAGPGECGVLKISAVTWGSFRPEENKALLPGDEPKPHERIKKGDLLITRANTSDLVGAVVLVDRDHPELMLPDKILRLRPKDATIDRRYLLQALRTQTVREHFERNATGTSESMRNLSQPKMAAAPITIAPLPEQRRIVGAVEALLEQVNRARERLDRVPLILQRFRQAVLAAACSGDLIDGDAERNVDGPYDFLPTLPEGWRWIAASDACARLVDCHNKTAPYSDAGIRLLRTTNIRNGDLVLDDARYVTEDTYKFWSRRCPPAPGDVIFTREAPMGEAAMIPPGMKVCMGQRMMLLRANDSVISRDYLLLVVQAPYVRKYAEEVAVGSGVLHMRVGDVERLPLPVPPRAEQDAIVRRAKHVLALASRLERRVRDATVRADKLPQTILSKAFSGELVPTEADLARAEGRPYETAAELLARIAKERESGLEAGGARAAGKNGRSSKRRAG